ncbi:ribonuclease PH [Spirulina sp. CCNP1310]|uniref:ribonuclease PH n=1 Tax=Spirulina sp. CCNP1310 TaxID=3110249 RepID=UPI002B1EFB4B|nr:ribonuclease PH [Spirulina sp. CCNP1310]MEA5419074.1 ribonuclease PH [Spirulina sp. CCNP1310]
MTWQRSDHRTDTELRPIQFDLNFTQFAAGSVRIHCGQTQVLCTATVSPGVPKFLEGTGQGWLTAEYRMLPSATPQRQSREWAKLSGRTQEIQRLIGRSLRAALNLEQLGPYTITVDSDVLQADAGTRTASITGGYVALVLALRQMQKQGELTQWPIRYPVAAVSVGLMGDRTLLDLNYPEDIAADIDCNVVMTGNLDLIEIQGTAESGSFSRAQLDRLLDVAQGGIQTLLIAQQEALKSMP